MANGKSSAVVAIKLVVSLGRHNIAAPGWGAGEKKGTLVVPEQVLDAEGSPLVRVVAGAQLAEPVARS